MKMTFAKRCLAVVAGSILTVAPAFAVEEAASIDELLKLINQAKVSESKEHQQREAEFLRQKQNQQNLLNQAKSTRAAEEARSETLEKAFAENELKVEALREQLNSMQI